MDKDESVVKGKAKKKKSPLQAIRSRYKHAKALYNYYHDLYHKKLDEFWRQKKKLDAIQSLFPKYYFKITFKAKNSNGFISEFEEVHMGIHANLIEDEVSNKCNDFKLISIEKIC